MPVDRTRSAQRLVPTPDCASSLPVILARWGRGLVSRKDWVESRVWVALSAASLTLFGTSFSPLASWIVFCATLFIYRYDDAVDPLRREPASPLGLLWPGLALALTIPYLSLEAALFIGGGGALALLYGTEVRLFRRRFRIKESSLAKPLFVALGVTIATISLPILITPRAWTEFDLARTIALLGIVGTNCLVFDLRDVDEDRASGLKTAPVRYGVIRVKRFLLGFNLTVVLLLGVAGAAGVATRSLALTVVAHAIFAGAFASSPPVPSLRSAIAGCMTHRQCLPHQQDPPYGRSASRSASLGAVRGDFWVDAGLPLAVLFDRLLLIMIFP